MLLVPSSGAAGRSEGLRIGMIVIEAVLIVGRRVETGVVAGRNRIGLGDGGAAGGWRRGSPRKRAGSRASSSLGPTCSESSGSIAPKSIGDKLRLAVSPVTVSLVRSIEARGVEGPGFGPGLQAPAGSSHCGDGEGSSQGEGKRPPSAGIHPDGK